MRFHKWMKIKNPGYKKSDDSVQLRDMRELWSIATESACTAVQRESKKMMLNQAEKALVNNLITAIRVNGVR